MSDDLTHKPSSFEKYIRMRYRQNEDRIKIMELLQENSDLKVEIERQKGEIAILAQRLEEVQHDRDIELPKTLYDLSYPSTVPAGRSKHDLHDEDWQYDDEQPPNKQQRAEGSQKPLGFGAR